MNTYNTAVNGPGGLMDVLNGQIATEQTTMDGLVAAADALYDSTMAGPNATYQSTVDSELATYNTWISGGGGNPYYTLVDTRTAAFETQVEGFGQVFETALGNAQDQLAIDQQAARQEYWDDVFSVGGPADIFRSTRDGALNVMSSGTNSAYGTYELAQNAYDNDVMNWMMDSMMAMMMGLPMPPEPSTATIDQAAHDYWVDVAIAEASASDTIGAAYLSFWTTEQAEETDRAQDMINAGYTASVSIENAQHALNTSGAAATSAFLHDIIDYTRDFAEGAAARYLTMEANVAAAANTLELAHHAAFEAYEESTNDALRDYEKNVATHKKSFRQQEATKWKEYTDDANASYEDLQNNYAAALEIRINDGAAAQEQFELAINGIINTRESNITALEQAFSTNVTAAVSATTTTIANQLAADMIAAMGGGVDETTVANAFATHTIGAVTAWGAALDTQATASSVYVTGESNQRLALNNAIASQEEIRVNTISGAMVTSVGNAAGDLKTYQDQVAGEVQTYAQNVAGHAETAQHGYFDSNHTFLDSTIGAGRIRSDSLSGANLNFVNSMLGSIGASVTSASPAIRQAQHDELDEEMAFEATRESGIHTGALNSLLAKKNTALTLVTLDDAGKIAAMNLAMTQRSVNAWQTVVAMDNTPVGDSMNPSGPENIMATMIYLDVPSPVDPSAPPPPPPPPPAPPSPPDVEMESPFWAGVGGFFSGLGTGAKAITNATADAGAQVVSLGQWDPPDVWEVDPATDLYYEQSRFFADIGVNAAAAAATGGLAGAAGRVGQVARAVDHMDTAANVINGVQGGLDAAENGLGWQNGAQIGIGLIGGAQGYSTVKSMKAAKVDEAISSVRTGGSTASAGDGALPSNLDEAVQGINPTGNRFNCAECSVRVDDVLAGGTKFPAAAADATTAFDRLETLLQSEFTGVLTKDELLKTIENLGDGGRGIVMGLPADMTDGHFFNAINQAGATWFPDGQVAAAATLDDWGAFRFMQTNS